MTYLMTYTIDDIKKDVDLRMSAMRIKKQVVNTRNALRLKRILKEKFNIEMYPAIFPLHANFFAYPGAFPSYIYYKEGKHYNRMYLERPVRFYFLKNAEIEVCIACPYENVLLTGVTERDEK